MKERMSKEERVRKLSLIMSARHAEARDQAVFTAASLASQAGISVVWFYLLVGKEFKTLRAQLPGSIPSEEVLIVRLKREVAELNDKLRTLKARYEASIKEKLAEAIRHIELLDKENRMLRETVAALEKRLNDNTLVISVPTNNNATSLHADEL